MGRKLLILSFKTKSTEVSAGSKLLLARNATRNDRVFEM